MDIAAIREALVLALADATGLTVTGHVPERLNPPLIYLHESDPFLTPEPDGPYGSYHARFAIDVIEAPTASNAAAIAAADKHAAQLLDLAGRYAVEVGAYATAPHAGQNYLTVPATFTTTTRKA